MVKKLLKLFNFLRRIAKKKKEFRKEKVIKRKENSYMLNEKAVIINLILELIKRSLYKMR